MKFKPYQIEIDHQINEYSLKVPFNSQLHKVILRGLHLIFFFLVDEQHDTEEKLDTFEEHHYLLGNGNTVIENNMKLIEVFDIISEDSIIFIPLIEVKK